MRGRLLAVATLAAAPACYFLTDFSGISDGNADASVALDGACPADAPGPSMVQVQGEFCIDSTEVTLAQYRQFLDSGPSLAGQPASCAANTSFVPNVPSNSFAPWPPDAGNTTLPVAGIDWCDAYAYCKWANKRLCGKIGGGSNAVSDATNPAKSQWYAACSKGGALGYPYGASYQAGACNDGTTTQTKIAPTGSFPACEGGVAGLFDMSGNVAEWEDSCSGGDCLARGGNFNKTNAADFGCDASVVIDAATQATDKGFRCCYP